jgi:hypothetical protein
LEKKAENILDQLSNQGYVDEDVVECVVGSLVRKQKYHLYFLEAIVSQENVIPMVATHLKIGCTRKCSISSTHGFA